MVFKIGIIDGYGLEDPEILLNPKKVFVDTPYGWPSDKLITGTINNIECILLARHGRKHNIMPTNVNYRANLWALYSLGAKVIIASTTSESLRGHVKPGQLVFPDSVFDRTTSRKNTFFDGTVAEVPGVCHIQMHPTYNERLRQALINTAHELSLDFHDGGFAVCIEGPRLPSEAESNVFRSWGALLVNMTMMPECALAKELGIPYATSSLVAAFDSWNEAEHIPVIEKTKRLFVAAVTRISQLDWEQEISDLKNSARHSVLVDKSVKISHLNVSAAKDQNQSVLEHIDTEEVVSKAPTSDGEEDEPKRSDEDAEKQQKRESELNELLEILRNRKEQVDLASMCYNREFLYCVRDIEKEFHRTNCPLTPKELYDFRIGINCSEPYNSYRTILRQVIEEKKRKEQKKARDQKSIELAESAPMLKTSENAWKPERYNTEDLDKEEFRAKFLLKKVRSLMNKITHTTKVELIDEFLECNVSSQPDQLGQTVDIIFDKAIEEPKFSPLYAEICRKQVDKEVGNQNNVSLFRSALLNRVQQTFGLHEKREEIDNETEIEFQEASDKFRRRKFGNIKFIGHLYVQALLSTKIVQGCLLELIEPGNQTLTDIDEECIQSVVQLIETTGKMLDQDTAQDVNSIFTKLEIIMPNCSNKTRFMIMNLLELRMNKWIPRKAQADIKILRDSYIPRLAKPPYQAKDVQRSRNSSNVKDGRNKESKKERRKDNNRSISLLNSDSKEENCQVS